MARVERYPRAAAFLARVEPWLVRHEDSNNLMLGLAYARALAGEEEPDAFWGTVEDVDGAVVGCVMRTPPHKVLVTDMPLAAAAAVVRALADVYEEVPAVLGPHPVASEIAAAWVAFRGGGWTPGMAHRIYRLDVVRHPEGVAGALRLATSEDAALAMRWAVGFARDTGIDFPASEEAVGRWIRRESLFVWEVDGTPVSIAVAQGRTRSGARVGYVYTPPAWRGRGYATASVAALSQRLLDSGLDFTVLYTDLANPTSNSIYRRIGYNPIADVGDYTILPER